ncbi:Mobile element protein [Streptococcus pneumoniae]|nr:Mobile element protein [Streptococcus pneumoniae]
MTEFSLDLLLKAIKLARSTYYYHLKQLDKPDKDQELKSEIQSIFIEHKGNYAYRRIYLELRNRGYLVNHKRVLSRAMSRVRVQIMNQFHRKSHEYKAIKRYWKLIQQDSRKLSDKHFYRPTFCMHLTNKEILDKLLSYSQDLKHHYQLYQLLLFHFQNKEPEKFFGLKKSIFSKVILC